MRCPQSSHRQAGWRLEPLLVQPKCTREEAEALLRGMCRVRAGEREDLAAMPGHTGRCWASPPPSGDLCLSWALAVHPGPTHQMPVHLPGLGPPNRLQTLTKPWGAHARAPTPVRQPFLPLYPHASSESDFRSFVPWMFKSPRLALLNNLFFGAINFTTTYTLL